MPFNKTYRRTDAIIFLTALILGVIYIATAGGGFPLDDSWIHQVYARNLAQFGEWSFIAGQPSAASTSPLYTVLLSMGYRLGIHYVIWTHALGIIALAIAGIIAVRMASRLRPKQGYLPLLSGLAIIFSWHLIWAAVSGMETMIFSMFCLLIVALIWREAEQPDETLRQKLLWGSIYGFVGGLTTLARPEGLGIVGLGGLVLITASKDMRRLIYWSGAAVIVFVLTLAPYLWLNLQLTGGLLPDTAAAKQAQNAWVIANFSFSRRFWEMVRPLLAGAQIMLIPGMLFFAYRILRESSRRLWFVYQLPFFWALALIAIYAARLPAPYQHGRYVIPVLAPLIVVGVVGTSDIVLRWRYNQLGRILTRSLALTTALIFVVFALGIGPGVYRSDVRVIEEEMVTAARWIAENIPPDELLAIHDIGAVGYFAPRPMLDIAGLVTPEIIPVLGDDDAVWDFMRRHNARYLMAFPDQIPGNNPNDPRLCLVFTTHGKTSPSLGGANMSVYELSWNGGCNS